MFVASSLQLQTENHEPVEVTARIVVYTGTTATLMSKRKCDQLPQGAACKPSKGDSTEFVLADSCTASKTSLPVLSIVRA